MPMILKLFLLLISIDQETILNFFGVDDPNNYIDPSYASILSSIDSTPVSTAVSIETLKLLFEGFLKSYQNGLGLVDIENIILFIAFIRFMILAVRYNIKTAFYISCISAFAAGLWYYHLKDLFLWYRDMMLWNRFTARFAEDSRSNEIMGEELNYFAKISTSQGLENPITFFKYILVQGTKRLGSDNVNYRIDPISMLMTKIPDQIKPQADKIYYNLFNRWIPGASTLLNEQIVEYLPLVTYLIIVRLNKKYCPYLIRWHWTVLLVFSIGERFLLGFIYRMQIYYANHLVSTEGRQYEEELVLQILITIVLLHFIFVLFGLLHAACGQYFYFPFVVENAEIHIGPRPLNSLYSGGHTAWQNSDNERRKWILIQGKGMQKIFLPRLWWGWFGRGASGVDFKSRYQQKNYRKKRKTGLVRFFKKLRKRFFNK